MSMCWYPNNDNFKFLFSLSLDDFLPNEMGSCCAKRMWIWWDLMLLDIIGHIIGGAFGSTVLLLLLFFVTLHFRLVLFFLNVRLQWVLTMSCHGWKKRLVKKKGETNALCMYDQQKCTQRPKWLLSNYHPSALYSHTCNESVKLQRVLLLATIPSIASYTRFYTRVWWCWQHRVVHQRLHASR